MCGIVGLISGRGGNPELIERLVDPLVHRGPDDRGTWLDRDAGMAFGHRRLAVVDLSPHGHQPMLSSEGRWVITYNGEIYNHRALRSELDNAGLAPAGGWRGSSDTETLLQAIAAWGLEAAVSRAAGMFAFGLWDRQEQKLALVRDRFGEKPLYYGWVGGDFMFASELKALTSHPRFANEVSRKALNAFASRIYVPAPLSIYRNVFKLQPGCMLEISAKVASAPLDDAPEEGRTEGEVRLRRYWSYGEVLARASNDPITSEPEAVDALEQVLGDAIAEQSMADVPVGAFLSGGIDSSTIVALYQKRSSVPVRSFTIGFEESHFNEADDARAVAERLGTIHDEKLITTREAAAVIPQLPTMFDEPFGDSSQIPTYLVSKFARAQVTVALSGDGGDELFAGYSRYWEALSVWSKFRKIPLRARRAGAAAAERIPFRVWTAAESLMGAPQRSPFSGRVIKALRAAASVHSFEDLYRGYLDQWAHDPSPVAGSCGGEEPFPLDPGFEASDALRMTYCDTLAYLPDDILCKVDRAAMAVSLETRVPFLDHRVAEVAARIPMSMKLGRRSGKKVLRSLLARHLPEHLFDRPKSGFSMPLGNWLRGDLRDWAEDLLDPARMREEGYFDPELIQRRWSDHLEKRRNASTSIWAILMFQSWLRSARAETSPLEARSHAA